MRLLLLCFLFSLFISCEKKIENTEVNFPTPYEISGKIETATYHEVIDFYIDLAKEFSTVNIQTIGTTDSGIPLHIVTFSAEGNFNFQKLGENKTILLINNGIHPGESDGIDATMLLFRDLAGNKITTPKETIVATIPVYNIGGALNRNSTSRANQNGPTEYGFRGNSRNYDLNRDFIKTDTKNAETFAQIYHLLNPDVFIDNHVSNGADYQYTLTHLFTQHNKLGGKLGAYLHERLMPQLHDSLLKSNWDITPYVNVFNRPPETGFQQFLDHPRYSTGYTALWNTLGMMVETHMLKPYDKRVKGTYELLKKMISITERDGTEIRAMRDVDTDSYQTKNYYPIDWKVDTTRATKLNFKGYQADTVISEVTGFPRLKYNRGIPTEKEVVYHDYFIPSDSIQIPKAYVIGKQWKDVLDRLSLNKIAYTTLKKDTIIEVESYKIVDYKTVTSPFEGHYLHKDTKVEPKITRINFTAGDIIVPTDQRGIRYLLETLEPSAVDSFFNWNFFDTMLQQKEGFSPYVFEDTALLMLEKDSLLKSTFEEKKKVDPIFNKNWYAQLDWLFKQSELYEKAHLQYPIYRIAKN